MTHRNPGILALTECGDPPTLGSRPSFTEEDYERAKPLFNKAWAEALEVVVDNPVENRRMEARTAEERIELAPIRLSHRVGRLIRSRTMAVVWLLAVGLVVLPMSYEGLIVVIGPPILKFSLGLLGEWIFILIIILTIIRGGIIGARWLYERLPWRCLALGSCSCSSPRSLKPDSRHRD